MRPAFLIASKLILEQTISICDNGDIFKRIFNSTQLRNCVELNMINNRKLTFSKYANFHPLEVVVRGSETQLQLGENLHKIP